MNKNRFDKQFELRYFEMNEFGVASPTTILTLLEETAAEHCYSINHSLYQLAEQNIGWVLISGLIFIQFFDKVFILRNYGRKGFAAHIYIERWCFF